MLLRVRQKNVKDGLTILSGKVKNMGIADTVELLKNVASEDLINGLKNAQVLSMQVKKDFQDVQGQLLKKIKMIEYVETLESYTPFEKALTMDLITNNKMLKADFIKGSKLHFRLVDGQLQVLLNEFINIPFVNDNIDYTAPEKIFDVEFKDGQDFIDIDTIQLLNNCDTRNKAVLSEVINSIVGLDINSNNINTIKNASIEDLNSKIAMVVQKLKNIKGAIL